MKRTKKDKERRLKIRLVTDKIILWLKTFTGDESIGFAVEALIQQRKTEIRSEVMGKPPSAKGGKAR